ncbi:MAG: DUF1194 domain-containing protein [Geminicoccaceae bacterium]
MPAVDLALVIAIDGSWSVDDFEHAEQILGTAEAFRSPAVMAAIDALPTRRIAVALMQWSRQESQVLSLPWVIVDGGADALRLADRIAMIGRDTREGGTSISGALARALFLLDRCPCSPARRTVDISADGRHNDGPALDPIRHHAVLTGVTVNGLAILNEVGTLNHYFEQRVIAGANAFVEKAESYKSYGVAMERKLLREISPAVANLEGLPLPGSKRAQLSP